MSKRPVEIFYIISRGKVRGYNNVRVHWFVSKRARTLFGRGGSLVIPYSDVITDYHDIADKLDRVETIEKLFRVHEAKTFVEFLGSHCGSEYRQTKVGPVKLPIRCDEGWSVALRSEDRTEGFVEITNSASRSSTDW